MTTGDQPVLLGAPSPISRGADELLRWRMAERGGYVVSGLSMVGIVLTFLERDASDRVWNVVSLVSLAVTGFAAAVAVTIFRVQAQKATSDQQVQGKLLEAIRRSSTQAAANSADAADAAREARDIFMSQMSTATEAAQAPEPSDEVSDDGLPNVDVNEPSVEEPAKEGDVIQVEGVGEYLRPPAVPLKVLADLVSWWRGPGKATGAWTVGNLIGAFRPYNKAGNLQGVPWILTFRRSNGDLAEYRVAYSGRKRKGQDTATPSVSRYSKGEARWSEGDPFLQEE